MIDYADDLVMIAAASDKELQGREVQGEDGEGAVI